MKLLLFDIDGTLVDTGGAGFRAFSNGMEEVFGLESPLKTVRLDGKTDPLILREALLAANQDENPDQASVERFFEIYLQNLGRELSLNTERYRVLPGVERLLELLASRPEIVLALATGNVERGARAKLEVANLNRFFQFGGFGCDSANRTELIQTAVARGRRLISPCTFDSVFVIGDTPHDISHGSAAGAKTVAVATGRYSEAELEECSPDLLLADLTAAQDVLRFLEQN